MTYTSAFSFSFATLYPFLINRLRMASLSYWLTLQPRVIKDTFFPFDSIISFSIFLLYHEYHRKTDCAELFPRKNCLGITEAESDFGLYHTVKNI